MLETQDKILGCILDKHRKTEVWLQQRTEYAA